MNLANAERNHEAHQEMSFMGIQEQIEKLAQERASLIDFRVTDCESEYCYLEPSNLMEAINESGMIFQTSLAAAVQNDDAIEALRIIKAESKLYWTQFLNGITE